LRVITVYAAVAFVILQLVEILAPSLRLPDWTMNLILVLLIVGFIIAVILSWIYDVEPEGGIVKTEPAHKAQEEDIPKSSNSWRIASYISFVVIVALIMLNIIPRTNRSDIKEILDKSIAVLPFINDSPDEENTYFINGTMEAIIDNLCKIEDLRVVGRTSVEQYRNAPKPIRVIAEEMNVSYILEGSGQKDSNKVRLTLQLIDGINDQHLWSSPYIKEIEIGQIFDLQSEIAELVAGEIKAVITPEEKQLIEKTPTSSLTAYDFYQRGIEEHAKYWLDNTNREALERAEGLYHKALEYDSAFALAYTGLAKVYRNKHYWEEFLEEDFMDSMLILADIALSLDDQLAEAYLIRGDYYKLNNKKEQAAKEYDKAIKFNPNSWQAYRGKGTLNYQADFIEAIDNLHTAALLHKGPFMSRLYSNLGFVYALAGFNEKAIYYKTEALKLDDDSADYYNFLADCEESSLNFEKAIEFGKKSLAIDSTDDWVNYRLGVVHSFLGFNEEYLAYLKKYSKRIESLDKLGLNGIFRLGHAYWVNGFKEEAEGYFNKGLRLHNEMLELGRHYLAADFIAFYNLAAVYAFLGDKEQAYENLRLVNPKPRVPFWLIKDLKNDPLFESIRDEPEFQQIVRDVEAKYHADHEEVRQWLEENEML